MRAEQHTVRQLLLGAALAIAIAAPITALPAPSTTQAACPTGEDHDTYTGNCVPYLVPNSPSGNTLCPAGVSGTECGSAEGEATPTAPIAPTGPEAELEDVSTPDF
ncbi:hypothetical protein A5731_27915 [Mycolicibacterium conceptionense]|uniref:Intersectin-EH binding protein Ibp1 n=1 Tax=Mycolicibacterium conceptionense TaxID=451644 RepID=A0A1A0PII1_9MYCO|nr:MULTISPECIES: hypothetical protein [Mycolicibacterium]MCW1824446.1 hypothetical protein [Mycolicibacterium senegalense]OBB09069.1 hypothetical protein A5718_12110 [Mycolicibacterium conceptionense]OBE94167.1 hypothetical protein A5731_27915 [Mycolicibacterium conceptionense]OBF21673.1 hypothetical protein A5726_14930 [Mycolicibacterium conceptionense]OBF45861.1 hypothetical protein A5720_07700 [Mycolicibacterium conceptionense]